MKRIVFALSFVGFMMLCICAPSARAQFTSGNLEFGPTIGAGMGFTHDEDAHKVCPVFKLSFPNGTCTNGSNAFKGYLDGSLDFISKGWWPGFGAGLVVGEEWNRSTQLHETNTGSNAFNDTELDQFRQFGTGINIYLPIPHTMQRVVLVPTIQEQFWTANVKITDIANTTFTDHYSQTGKATMYGGSLRYRLTNHLYAEGGVSYELIPESTILIGISSSSALNLWDYRFGLRWAFRDLR